ncbi:hypothetical protein E2P81_ATG11703 [Venturia nashicola]|nr:hypothetical protein E2P81_ATG11703 [Venturia nashicola]
MKLISSTVIALAALVFGTYVHAESYCKDAPKDVTSIIARGTALVPEGQGHIAVPTTRAKSEAFSPSCVGEGFEYKIEPPYFPTIWKWQLPRVELHRYGNLDNGPAHDFQSVLSIDMHMSVSGRLTHDSYGTATFLQNFNEE